MKSQTGKWDWLIRCYDGEGELAVCLIEANGSSVGLGCGVGNEDPKYEFKGAEISGLVKTVRKALTLADKGDYEWLVKCRRDGELSACSLATIDGDLGVGLVGEGRQRYMVFYESARYEFRDALVAAMKTANGYRRRFGDRDDDDEWGEATPVAA